MQSESKSQTSWGWSLLLGALVTLIGLTALSAPIIASLGTAVFFGALVFLGGVAEFFGAFHMKGIGDVLAEGILALLALAAGAYLMTYPGGGLLTLTWIAGVYLAVEGIVRAWAAFRWRPLRGWGFGLAGGLVTLLLGAMVLLDWPGSSLWFFGTVVGLRLLAGGAMLMSIAWTRRAVAAEWNAVHA